MKLSLSLFVITLALSATTTAYGVECGEFDSICSEEYDVPGGDGGPAIENICPDDPSGECGGELEGVTCQVGNARFKCENGVFGKTNEDVGTAFMDPPTATPKPPCGTPEECSGTAVITGTAVVISKDSEETDVSGIDIGIDDSAASSTAIVSSIVGITAAVGVVALL
ncbi:hypothetical protein FRACYDRAFT_269719 [Fragilariopsis cylindrus CCMP1102]|uniref:Uncharacterized protein n=1 Tax=Fragilariopsis cylindrus CCMP1102 TaxID=635003 RepID=A0A1E7F9W1_9STRA|nr:hypothetical protein FRACYDRAFT_269719 [Fragilariopsis cylindrus CCMP1102]|eukprot:OEU14936.1 hypothetical protein FRACYDRAFT_269719 [Fragilariopsis cylindrus CCMP1102]